MYTLALLSSRAYDDGLDMYNLIIAADENNFLLNHKRFSFFSAYIRIQTE